MSLRSEIESVINRNSAERASDTPDYILAEFLLGCLTAFDAATRERDRWYGRTGLTNAAGKEDIGCPQFKEREDGE